MQIYLFSFFSGLGFLDAGFEKENFKIAFVNEFNPQFLKAYQFSRKHMGGVKPKLGYYQGSIEDLLLTPKRLELSEQITTLRKKNLIGFIGGPPCPDFSIAGKNHGIDGENGKLTKAYVDIIVQQNPDFFIFENVKGLWSTKKHKEEYTKIKNKLLEQGYVLIDRLVNALSYGVPQDRERVLLFGIRSELLSTDRALAQKILIENFDWSENYLYLKQELKAYNWPKTNAFMENSTFPMPMNIIQELTVEHWFIKNDVENHHNSDDYFFPRSIERFYNIAEGDVSKKSFKRLHRWRYSPAAAYGNNEVHLHPYKPRRLSVAEALAIQSLPSDFILPREIPKSDMFKMIGNGVPYLVSCKIAKNIKKFLTSIGM